MILEQLNSERLALLNQPARKTLQQMRRNARRRYVKLLSQTKALIARQYFISDALRDGRAAITLNEDIFLGSVLLGAGIGFAVISLAANIIYTFVLAGTILSQLSGISLALWVVLALSVIGVLGAWIAGFINNLIILSLTDGIHRKRNRSLAKTVRRSLAATSNTVSAWLVLAFVVFAPTALLCLAVAVVLHIFGVRADRAVPYLIGAAVLAGGWILGSSLNFALLPQVALVEAPITWRNALARSKQLVNRKGRLFIASSHVLLVSALVGAYGIALAAQAASHTSSTLIFLTLLFPICVVHTIIMTMLYHKRKRARS
ncbi:hypothetical protein H7Y63_00545 [Polaromonas sp.]|nr:hypothetical protein [Candidatus Saccharibacteria bacterium]